MKGVNFQNVNQIKVTSAFLVMIMINDHQGRHHDHHFLQVVYDEDGCYSRPDYFGEEDK